MLSELAEKIFKSKYARGDETWEQASMRVAAHVASAELQFPKGEEQFKKHMQLFYDMIVSKKVLPGGLILANAGTGIKNLYSCFVLPIEDTRDSIYKTLHDAANIFAWGGGCGFNFSNLREEGAKVTTTNGSASGPLSFMELFNTTGEVISQSNRR
jgi:ribonucleoside-diphosphate reductase alpha chain